MNLEDVRRSQLTPKERAVLEYYEQNDKGNTDVYYEVKTEWTSKKTAVISFIGMLNAGIFVIARFMVMFYVIQVSLVIVF